MQLHPSATLKEIKAAYRKLAHQYHPDKSSDDKYALAQFNLIKEAYEVLTDQEKKDLYHQQRWYDKSINRKSTSTPSTPASILKQCLILEKDLARLDIYRMNPQEVQASIENALSDRHIEILNTFNEDEVNRVVVTHLSRCIEILPEGLGNDLSKRLGRVRTDDASTALVIRAEKKASNARRMDRLHPWIIAIIVIILCMLIYFISD